MGKISKVHYEKLINPIPDRACNRVKVQESPNGEVTIHFRNMKIVLFRDEIDEWVSGFRIALDNYNSMLPDLIGKKIKR